MKNKTTQVIIKVQDKILIDCTFSQMPKEEIRLLNRLGDRSFCEEIEEGYEIIQQILNHIKETEEAIKEDYIFELKK